MRKFRTLLPLCLSLAAGATACAVDAGVETDPDRGMTGKADFVGSCATDGDQCGFESPDGCYCDDQCTDFGDCCSDKAEVCDACVPATCDDLGAGCGEADDGCGGTIDCGLCPSDDPFEPTCTGAVMTQAKLAELFSPGAASHTLGQYEIAVRERTCTEPTGCGPWMSVPAGDWWETGGTANLQIENSADGPKVVVNLVKEVCTATVGNGNPIGAKCLGDGSFRCSDYKSLLEINAFPGSNNTGCVSEKVSLGDSVVEFEGLITDDCLHFLAEGSETSDAVTTEYEAALFLRM